MAIGVLAEAKPKWMYLYNDVGPQCVVVIVWPLALLVYAMLWIGMFSVRVVKRYIERQKKTAEFKELFPPTKSA